MATQVLTDARIWWGEYRLDTQATAMSAEYGAEQLDATAFGDSTRIASGGLKTLSLGLDGFFEGTSTDVALYNDIGVTDVPITLAGDAAAAGAEAYFSKYLASEYNPRFDVGELAAFSGAAVGRDAPLLRGTVLFNGSDTASGTGSGVNVGSVGATESLYAALHVTSASAGDTLDVTIESDATDSWAGAETTRITFSQVGASAAYEWATPVAGAITDTWWRVNYTLGGASPDYTFAVVMGIV